MASHRPTRSDTNVIDRALTAWIDARLAAAGCRRTEEVRVHRERFWASVHEVPTDAGPAWVKVLPPGVTNEAALYRVLADAVPDVVLVPLGVNVERRCVLLPDGGRPFSERLAGDELAAAVRRAMTVYARSQQTLAPRLADLLTTGTPDMRPRKMPERLDEALRGTERFAVTRGTSEQRDTHAAVRRLVPTFAQWCDELAGSRVPASIDHNDLHAGNMIGSVDRPRFWDWGDAAVAHPFASLLFALESTPGSARPALRDAYLAEFGDPAELAPTARLAIRIGQVARALVWLHALSGTGELDVDHPRAAAPLEHLRRLLF